MAERKLSCLRCQGDMETGFTVDNAYYMRAVSSWMPGAPEFRTFFGKSKIALTKMKDRTAISTTTYRCKACGYLESYAGP
jgi:hypothetical protein